MIKTKESITKREDGTLVTPKGFAVAGLHSGVKFKHNDLGVIYSEIPANVSAVYTTNAIQAAPLIVTKKSIAKEGKMQAIIVNSGNANACTGEQGMLDAREMQRVTAEHLKLPNHFVGVASTGVIGQHLETEKILPHIKLLKPKVDENSAIAFNESILTTDTNQKTTCYQATIDGKTVTMAGSAKGSGMIEPNMATMLAFITTDIKIDTPTLDRALKQVVNNSFNCITVDGDTSTNDTAMIMANGLAENEPMTEEHAEWSVFIALLKQTCEDLAKMIARDGEGATKLIEVKVSGAKSDEEAIKVAKSIVGSSLVKTAVYGSDANWGRVIAAVGYSGAQVNPNSIDMAIGPIELLKKSQPLTFSEEEAKAYLKNEEIEITVDLNIGDGKAKSWGCDLTYDYVQINASYRS